MVLALALAAMVVAGITMVLIARTDPWYRNLDMNIHNTDDALAINASVAPNPFAQPAVPLKYLLALDFRVRHELGLLPVWNLRKLGASPDPVHELPALIRAGRVHSMILVLLLVLCAAGLTGTVTRDLDVACLTVILLSGSAGLLFQGLLTRPELLCVGLGNILALWCAWQGTAARGGPVRHAWLFLAGFLVGLATMEKLPGICYLVLVVAWCWLAALIDGTEAPGPGRAKPGSGLLPAAGGLSVLWLLHHLGPWHDALGSVVVLRLRVAAVAVGGLPLLALWPRRSRTGRFLLGRIHEMSLLGGGVLAALPFCYLLLRGVMAGPAAATYFTGAVHFVVNPGPTLKNLVGAQDVAREVFYSFWESPVLFCSATALAVGVALVRTIPLRLRALILLLPAVGLGFAYLMSQRHYAAHYAIFSQVPLLLAWALALAGLKGWWLKSHPSPGTPWAVPLAFTAALILACTVFFRVQPKYHHYQDDIAVPVNDLALTFLFDHDAHTGAYLDIMKTHYGDRGHFREYLDHYLADPANRY